MPKPTPYQNTTTARHPPVYTHTRNVATGSVASPQPDRSLDTDQTSVERPGSSPIHPEYTPNALAAAFTPLSIRPPQPPGATKLITYVREFDTGRVTDTYNTRTEVQSSVQTEPKAWITDPDLYQQNVRAHAMLLATPQNEEQLYRST